MTSLVYDWLCSETVVKRCAYLCKSFGFRDGIIPRAYFISNIVKS